MRIPHEELEFPTMINTQETPTVDAPENRFQIVREERSQGPIRLRRITSWERLQAYYSDWEDVLQDSEGPTIFSTPEWLGAWWRAFARGNELTALVFFDEGDRVIGLAPLYLDSIELLSGLRIRRLRFVGDGSHDSDNLDMIFRRGFEQACVVALINWLSSEPGWDVCELNTMPASSPALSFLLSRLKQSGWRFLTHETECTRIMLPLSWDEYLSHISKKERKKINYLTRRLECQYVVQIDKCASDVELSNRLEKLFKIHQGHWQTRGWPGTFASPERRKFYHDIGASFLGRGWLEFWELRLDEHAVATQFCFRYRDTVFALQEGFDCKFSSESIGYVLRANVLKNLIFQGVRVYDFLAGRNHSKERWGAEVGSYFNVHFARPFTRGSLYLNLGQGVRSSKNWLKTSLPTPALNLTRKIYHLLRAPYPYPIQMRTQVLNGRQNSRI